MILHILALALLATSVRGVEPGYLPLLDREHTEGWRQAGPGQVRLSDGEATLSSTKGNGVYWYATRSFTNFILKLEFKGLQREFNSGVFVRFPKPSDSSKFVSTSGNEIAIYDGLDGDQPTGSIYNLQESSSATIKRDDWNEFEISVIEHRMVVKLNGKTVNDFTGLREPMGYIGLQCHSRGPVQFRNIRIQDVTSSAPQASLEMPAPALPPIQTDPNQPRIEVIRDQGPNAVEWALAPLEEPIPPNIRQNLTYLREDLLDEAKAGPKAPAEAYRLGSDYCDKILAALRLREQARVQAGYRAAQADADIKVTNSQLDARRNYQMSWPQYHREESQRAALREQESNKADLKKEKVKVEWSARADQMRGALDAGYRQLRESMR